MCEFSVRLSICWMVLILVPTPGWSHDNLVDASGTANNAKLKGQYAFLMSGYDGDGSAAMAGSFVADGKGNITNGLADYDFSSGGEVLPNLTFTGTYSVDSNNRANLNVIGVGFPQSFSVALGKFSGGVSSRGELIELDKEQIWVTGVIAKQDSTAFSTASVNGGYAFGFAGNSSTGWPLTVAGRFSASNGKLTAGQSDIYGLGLTQSGGGTVVPAADVPFTGSYTVGSSGRGTTTLDFGSNSPGFSNFVFYVVSAQELFFIEMDTCQGGVRCTFKGGISGKALQQSGGVFSNTSLKGSVVFDLTVAGKGTRKAGSVAVGIETFDGNGSVGGTKTENDAGSVSNGVEFEGQYSVDANGLGRGLLTLTGDSQPRPFYIASPGKAFTIDFNGYAFGEFEPQTGKNFSDKSLSGKYALGSLPWNFNWEFSPFVAVMKSDGAGGLSGVTDGHGGTDQGFSGTYSVAPSGEVDLLMNTQTGHTANWVFYMISNKKAVGIDIDSGTYNRSIAVIEK